MLKTEITRIGEATEFNGKKLLNGSLGVTAAPEGTITGVTEISVNGTSAGHYTISTETNATSGLDVTITREDGVSQTINVTAPTGSDTLDVNFDHFGISIKIDSSFTDASDGTINVTGTGIDIQIGANNADEQKLQIDISDMTAGALGKGVSSIDPDFSVDDVNVLTNEKARDAIDIIEKAINQVSAERSKLGAYQNRLEHTIKNLDTSAENLQASESRIRDVDMAKEMMEYTKNMILQQAAQAMLAQANQAPQGVLQLLR